MKQTRLDQLADGIFAIIMTVLVFNIKIPEHVGTISDLELVNVLYDLHPVFLSYLLSFALIFTYWRSHHLIASVLAKNIDIHFSNLNAVFFFFVGLVPFSSYLLGGYGYTKTAIIFFACNIIFIGISLYCMREHVLVSKNIENTLVTEEENIRAKIHILFPVFSAIFAMIVSVYSNEVAIVFFTLAVIFNIWENGAKHTYSLIHLFKK